MSTGERTNVLLLMSDQHRVDTLGCYGNDVCQTPTRDSLAESGTRFEVGATTYDAALSHVDDDAGRRM